VFVLAPDKLGLLWAFCAEEGQRRDTRSKINFMPKRKFNDLYHKMQHELGERPVQLHLFGAGPCKDVLHVRRGRDFSEPLDTVAG
jgi:hypothetical protein